MELEQGEECEGKGLMNLRQQAPHQKTWNCHPMIETTQHSAALQCLPTPILM